MNFNEYIIDQEDYDFFASLPKDEKILFLYDLICVDAYGVGSEEPEYEDHPDFETDIEHFKDRPIIWQDIWLYYYLKHELKSKLMKKGFIKQYEKEIIEPKNIAFGELFDSYKILVLC